MGSWPDANRSFLKVLSPYIWLTRMPILESMMYAAIALDPLYIFPFYGLALIPQVCLIHGIPLYPKVSDPFFIVFPFLFFSSQLKHLIELFLDGDSIRTWVYELRTWMMKSATCYMYGTLDAILDKLGLNEAIFLLTNKVVANEQAKRHQRGIYDFQASTLFVAPMCSLYILNMDSLIMGILRNFLSENGKEMLIQAFIPIFGVVLSYHLLEGMVLRKNKAGISLSVSFVSAVVAAIFIVLGSLIIIY